MNRKGGHVRDLIAAPSFRKDVSGRWPGRWTGFPQAERSLLQQPSLHFSDYEPLDYLSKLRSIRRVGSADFPPQLGALARWRS